jgi:hypothetical protein
VYKWNLARNVFELRQQPAAGDDVMHLALFHRKANRTARLDPIGLGVYHGPGELLFTREELDDVMANSAVPLHDRIHTLLLAGGRTPTQIAEQVGAGVGVVRTTLGRMRSLGLAIQLQAKEGREHVWGAIARGMTPPPQGNSVLSQKPEEEARWD